MLPDTSTSDLSPRWRMVAFDDQAKYYVNMDHLERDGDSVTFWGRTESASGDSSSIRYQLFCPDFEFRQERQLTIQADRQRSTDYGETERIRVADHPFLVKCFELFCGEKRTSFHSNGNLRERGWVFVPRSGGTPVKTGLWTYWHDNGVRSEELSFKNGRKEGAWKFWDREGRLWKEYSYRADKRNGPAYTWFPNGKKSLEMNYEDGRPKGKATRWNKKGDVIEEKMYTGTEDARTDDSEQSIQRP